MIARIVSRATVPRFGLLSARVCLALIDLCLIFLIAYDRRRHFAARPYVVALAAYIIVEAIWLVLGRPV